MVGFFLLLCVCMNLFTGAEAYAQSWSPGRPSHEKARGLRIVPPHVVVRRLTNRGYHAFRSLEFRDGTYVVRAVNGRGKLTRVIVDARTGKVID